MSLKRSILAAGILAAAGGIYYVGKSGSTPVERIIYKEAPKPAEVERVKQVVIDTDAPTEPVVDPVFKALNAGDLTVHHDKIREYATNAEVNRELIYDEMARVIQQAFEEYGLITLMGNKEKQKEVAERVYRVSYFRYKTMADLKVTHAKYDLALARKLSVEHDPNSVEDISSRIDMINQIRKANRNLPKIKVMDPTPHKHPARKLIKLLRGQLYEALYREAAIRYLTDLTNDEDRRLKNADNHVTVVPEIAHARIVALCQQAAKEFAAYGEFDVSPLEEITHTKEGKAKFSGRACWDFIKGIKAAIRQKHYSEYDAEYQKFLADNPELDEKTIAAQIEEKFGEIKPDEEIINQEEARMVAKYQRARAARQEIKSKHTAPMKENTAKVKAYSDKIRVLVSVITLSNIDLGIEHKSNFRIFFSEMIEAFVLPLKYETYKTPMKKSVIEATTDMDSTMTTILNKMSKDKLNQEKARLEEKRKREAANKAAMR